jgi:hypothetical protein
VKEINSITLTFRAPPPRERLALYFRAVTGVRSLFLLFPALLPGATLAALGANAPFTAWALGIGIGIAAFTVAAGAFSALVLPPPARTVTLTADTVREMVGDATIDRGWPWVVDFHETDERFVVRVRGQAMKSFRLTNPAPTLLYVEKRSELPEIIAFLRRLLALRSARGV